MMKNFNPTPEQKKKLIEMCKYFYKDRFDIFEYDSLLFILFNNFKIHWFEFCFTDLPMSIFCALADKDSDEDWSEDDKMFQRWDYFNNFFREMKGLSIWTDPIHPIDYLYSEFISLLNY